MIGTGSPGGTEQPAAGLDLVFADGVAMAAHYRLAHGIVSPLLHTCLAERSGSFGVRETVGRGKVGLDVEEGRAVDAIDTAHAEHDALDADNLYGGDRDRIGPH